MGDLKSPRLIYLKGILFLLAGITTSVLLFIELPTLKVAFLLAIAIWCFSRCYYFAFYVIEKYVDQEFKFTGLIDFAKYLLAQKSK